MPGDIAIADHFHGGLHRPAEPLHRDHVDLRLGPEVMRHTFGHVFGQPPLFVARFARRALEGFDQPLAFEGDGLAIGELDERETVEKRDHGTGVWEWAGDRFI